MRQVELLDQAFDAIKQMGFEIREETVGGNGGGVCVVPGHKWFFVDPLLGIREQLELAADALRTECRARRDQMPAELRDYLFPEVGLQQSNDETARRRAA